MPCSPLFLCPAEQNRAALFGEVNAVKRVLAVDYGRRRVGVAVSDELGATAQGLSTLRVEGMAEAVTRVADTASEWAVREIVVER